MSRCRRKDVTAHPVQTVFNSQARRMPICPCLIANSALLDPGGDDIIGRSTRLEISVGATHSQTTRRARPDQDPTGARIIRIYD